MLSLSCFCPAVISFLLYQLSGAGSTHWNWNSGKKNEGIRLPVNISPRWNMELNFILVITKHDDQRVSGHLQYFCTFKRSHLMLNAQHLHIEFRELNYFPLKWNSFPVSSVQNCHQKIRQFSNLKLKFESWRHNTRPKKKGCILYIYIFLTFSHKMRLI